MVTDIVFVEGGVGVLIYYDHALPFSEAGEVEVGRGTGAGAGLD